MVYQCSHQSTQVVVKTATTRPVHLMIFCGELNVVLRSIAARFITINCSEEGDEREKPTFVAIKFIKSTFSDWYNYSIDPM